MIDRLKTDMVIENSTRLTQVTGILRINKHDAAMRQLNRAIRMHFAEEDPVCTHTLAGAASILLTDLVEHHHPGSTWDKKAQEANHLGTSAYFQIARRQQNFLKHARGDPTETLDFNPSDTDALLMLAVFNASELGQLSPEADVYQLRGLALLWTEDMKSDSRFREAVQYFGDLQRMGRGEQLAAGRRGLLDISERQASGS